MPRGVSNTSEGAWARRYDSTLMYSYWKENIRFQGLPENLEILPYHEIEEKIKEHMEKMRHLGKDANSMKRYEVPVWARRSGETDKRYKRRYEKPNGWLKSIYSKIPSPYASK